MTIEQALLSTRDHLKLNLLLTLIETTPQTDLTQFATAQHLNYAQAYNLLTSLTVDLRQAGYQSSMQGGQLTTNITVDQYRQWLYRSTIAYQCLMSSLMNEYASAAAFCEAKKISSSTLQRHLQTFRPMFQQLHLRFSPQRFTLLGDETNIQVFFYQFLTSTFTILPTNPQFLSWRAQVQQAYQKNGQVQVTIGIQQQQQQILNLSLLRLQQGHPLTQVTMVPAPKINLNSFQSSLERWFSLTSQQAAQQLQTLNYLLTWSPLSISSMRPLALLQSSPASQSASWLLTQNANQLSVGPSKQDWLQAVTLFIVNFGVSPLLNLPQIDHSADAKIAQTITAVIEQFQQRYHCQLSEPQLRLLDQLLPAYCQALAPLAQQPNLLIGQEMLTVSLALISQDYPPLGQVQLIDPQNAPNLADQANSLVVYSVDPTVQQFAQEHHLPTFHWIKELGAADNIKRLLDRFYQLKLGIFKQP